MLPGGGRGISGEKDIAMVFGADSAKPAPKELAEAMDNVGTVEPRRLDLQ